MIVGADIVQSKNPKYGAKADDVLLNQGILKEGETIRYSFVDEQGSERKYDSKSAAIYIAFKSANLEPKTWVTIARSGQGDSTRYVITPAESEAASEAGL